MNYRGSMPQGPGVPGINDPQNPYIQQQQAQYQQHQQHQQQPQQHHFQQQYQPHGLPSNYGAYAQPQYHQQAQIQPQQQQQYQASQYAQYGYHPQQQQQQQNYQMQNAQPRRPSQQHHVQMQQIQPQGLDYSSGYGQPTDQYQSFDTSYGHASMQMPQNSQQQYSAQTMGISQAQQQAIQQQQQVLQQQRSQYGQQMDWQQMPPPTTSTIPTSSYQSPSPQLPQAPQPPARPQQQQTQQQVQQRRQSQEVQIPQQPTQPRPQQIQSPSPQIAQQQRPVQRQHSLPNAASSPMVTQSPKLPQQSSMSNAKRLSSAGPQINQPARVSASPRLPAHAPTRSSSVSSTRSPAPAPGLIPHHTDTNALLISVAEELFDNARESAAVLADSMDARSLKEYHKMVATGLGCLEVVLGSHKLAPRVEARLQLRYASILAEETNNVMEAETALTKGITLCERNRFADLKYAMQFLQIKMLAQRRGKAAMISVDARIKDAEVMKHTHWIYAFRFLKASLFLQSSHPAEAPALENLKAISALAAQRSDRAVFIVATLLEGLSLLRAMKEDAIVRIQGCLAQVAKYQLEETNHLMQLDILMLMLDLACSLHQKTPHIVAQKFHALQERLDMCLNSNDWGLSETEMLVPLHKQSSSQFTISEDTSAILRPGTANDQFDYLAISFWSKLEAFTITYTYSGLGTLYQTPRNDKKISELWKEAMNQLEKNAYRIRGVPTSLSDAVSDANWRRELKSYLHILRGLHLATHSKWGEVRKCIDQLKELVKPPYEGLIGLYTLYLSGVYSQGTGDLNQALNLFSNPSFDINTYASAAGSSKQAELEVSMLAVFNRIWIMQHPSYRDESTTQDLLERLRTIFPDPPPATTEIATQYNLLLSAIQTNPPIPMTAVKAHISGALNGSKKFGDVQTLSIALCLMQAKLFQGIVGEQALKSARAASQQAKRSGNMLWMSVADGMMAVSLETQGQVVEANQVRAEASRQAGAVRNAMAGREPV